MIYKLFLRLNDGTLDNETDYYGVSRYEAFADFCDEYNCTPDDVFCRKLNDESDEYLLNIFSDMNLTIVLALTSHKNEESYVATNVGRFKWQLDNYADIAGDCEINHLNNYLSILEYLKQKFTLSDDDLSDLRCDYDDWIHEFAEDVYQRFADYCENVEQYNDHDEFIDFIGKERVLLFFEMQYIEYLFTDDKREQYNRFK